MKEENLNNRELKTAENNSNSELSCQVGLPPLQLNEIYNDDSFKLIERVPAKTVDLILEDMPYNTTACEWDVKIDLELYWKTRLRILKPTGVVVLTASQPFTTILANSNLNMLKYEWIWVKSHHSNFLLADKQPLKIHENVLVFYDRQPQYNPIKTYGESNHGSQTWKNKVARRREIIGQDLIDLKPDLSGIKNPISIQYFNSVDKLKQKHPTEKPVGLFEYLIRTYTNEGDLVFDGFGGSGTTAIAAHKSKRNFIVIEKEKKYFDLAVRRLDNERKQLTML